jgi:hypothetical protein
MKKRLSIVLFAALLAFALQGCVGFAIIHGSGLVSKEDRQVSGFKEVALSGQGTLHVQVGRKESLRIEAEHNLMRYLETKTIGGDRLRIGVRNGVLLRNTRPIHYYLTVKDLNAVVLSGNGKIIVPDLKASSFAVTISGSGNIEMNDLEADDVQIRISGSGDLSMDNLDAGTLDVDMSGSGDLNIADGDVREQTIAISGAGKYTARGLDSEETSIRVSGSGTATVQVSEALDAQVTGSGSVHYLGRPAVETTVSGSGDVKHIGG